MKRSCENCFNPSCQGYDRLRNRVAVDGIWCCDDWIGRTFFQRVAEWWKETRWALIKFWVHHIRRKPKWLKKLFKEASK
jgi:hypothetical protein